MNWLAITQAAFASAAAVFMTDWLFFGVLFHDRYQVHPEVWRSTQSGKHGAAAVVWSTLFATLSCVLFVLLCATLHETRLSHALLLALCIWLMTALPLTITNALFIKFPPALVVSHSLGWLARLLAPALAVGWLIG